jgi:hypothetical protein
MYSTLRILFNNNHENDVLNFNKYFFNTISDIDNNDINILLKKNNNNVITIDNQNKNFENLDIIKNNNSFLNLEKIEKSYDDKTTQTYLSNNNYIQQNDLTKLYLPKPFNASQTNIYNGLP